MQYHEVSLWRPADPLFLLHHLAAELPRPQIIYECAGVWSFAAGALGEVLLDRRGLAYAWSGRRHSLRLSSRPLADVARALGEFPLSSWTAYGWVAFEYGRLQAGLRVPDGTLLHLIVPSVQVRINSYSCVIRGVDPWLIEHLRDRLANVDGPRPVAAGPRPVRVDSVDPGPYQRMVAEAVAEIRRGHLQKVVLSRRVPVGFDVDLLATYRAGHAAISPSRSFLLDTPEMRAVGFALETMLAVQPDGRVRTHPLAGTRVGGDDAARTATLRADPVQVLEHAIAVKLAVEEFRRICVPRSTVIDDYMTVADRGGVRHLESRVSGRLPAHRTSWDAFEAVFPAVTASGTPKAAAFDCIARLESRPRGLYAGAVLSVEDDGSLDAGVVLQTLVGADGTAWLQAGAGVVATSDPAREYEETCAQLRGVTPYLVPQVGK
ncbi:MAG TPA: salicylate synthase [Streptosporangiaceae bacterium]|nr:salicylate synthase [Streptosporangiaceae bacterium]